MAKELTVVRKISDSVFEVKEYLRLGINYTVEGKPVVCGRIMNGKQIVSTRGLLLKKEEELSELNWLR